MLSAQHLQAQKRSRCEIYASGGFSHVDERKRRPLKP